MNYKSAFGQKAFSMTHTQSPDQFPSFRLKTFKWLSFSPLLLASELGERVTTFITLQCFTPKLNFTLNCRIKFSANSAFSKRSNNCQFSRYPLFQKHFHCKDVRWNMLLHLPPRQHHTEEGHEQVNEYSFSLKCDVVVCWFEMTSQTII